MNRRILSYLTHQMIIIQFLKLFKGDSDVSDGVFTKLSYPRFLALLTIKELPFYSPDDVKIVSASAYKTFFGYNKRFSEMQSRIYFQVKLNEYYFLRNLKDNRTFKFDSLAFVIDLHTALINYKNVSFNNKLSFDIRCENENDDSRCFLQLLRFKFTTHGLKFNEQTYRDSIFGVIQKIGLSIKEQSAKEYKNYRIGKIIS